VGATPDTDRTIVRKVAELYAGGGVHHAQFSAFRPIRDTPMENVPSAPALREQRLYQADHLMRLYGSKPTRSSMTARGIFPWRAIPRSLGRFPTGALPR